MGLLLIQIKPLYLVSPMYISNFVHSGNVPSIRDDIISLCYVFIKITLGETPMGYT